MSEPVLIEPTQTLRILIEPTQTLRILRATVKQLGRADVDLPAGAMIVHAAPAGQNVELTCLYLEADVPTVRRRLYFVPCNHGARTPVSAAALSLIGSFEAGAIKYLLFEELSCAPATRAAARTGSDARDAATA